MRVLDVMQCGVKTCFADESLERAAQIMWEHDCGCVPVLDRSSKLVGIVTDRDVCMGAYTQGRPLREVAVTTSMSRTVWSCRPEDSLSVAEGILQKRRIRRLPVVDDSGRVVGILSLNDIARQAARERAQKRKSVSDAEVGETLSAICQPNVAMPAAASGAKVEDRPAA